MDQDKAGAVAQEDVVPRVACIAPAESVMNPGLRARLTPTIIPATVSNTAEERTPAVGWNMIHVKRQIDLPAPAVLARRTSRLVRRGA